MNRAQQEDPPELRGVPFWPDRLQAERIKAEVGEAVALLILSPPARILELWCGQGDYSIELAKRGFRVVGMDPSESKLTQARQRAAAAGVHVEWLRQDIRAMPFANRFDAVLDFRRLSGYLESEEEDRKALAGVHRALRPGGKFLLDFLNTPVEPDRERPSHRQRGATDPSDRWRGASAPKVRPQWYTPAELIHVLQEAGLIIDGVFGNLQRAPLAPDSPRVVIVSHRGP